MRKTLSVAIITRNEEANLERTLGSVAWADEIVVVDSGSDDRTEEIARSYRSRFYVEEWKGFAAQKNSALEKCSGEWILSLDADEALSDELAKEIWELLERDPPFDGYALPRRNLFLGRFIRYVREPFLLAFSTASSEAAYPKTLEGLEKFGAPNSIASFVLPDSVNDAVQWTLYGLMAAGIYAGSSGRRTGAKSISDRN